MQPLPNRNPFNAKIVPDPRHVPAVDVPGIHQQAFETCVNAVKVVRENKHSASLVLYGEPGAGKTHLLARLRRYLDGAALANRGALSVCVAIRLNTSPRRIWQHVREQFVDELHRKFAGDRTYLAWITAIKLSEESVHKSGPELWYSYLIQPVKDKDGMTLFLNETVHDRNLAIVLRHLFLGEYPLDARAWLRGESLPEAVLERMGVGPEELDARESAEDRARNVVEAICRLSASIPFVFCFDQIEALRTESSSGNGLETFGRMAADLHDGASNAVIISCIQSAFLSRLQREVRAADRDRIMNDVAELAELPPDQCIELASQLLDSVSEIREMDERKLARAAKKLWPLDEAALGKKLAELPRTPRRLIAACAELYQQAATGKATAIEPSVEQIIESDWRAEYDKGLAENKAESATEILQVALPEALAFYTPEWKNVDLASVGCDDVTAVYENAKGQRVGWSVLNQVNMRSLAARLEHIREHVRDAAKKYARFVILRHPALSISVTAKKCFEHLKALSAECVPYVLPPVESLAGLHAFRELLAAAKSGDLAHRGETVPIDTVRAWLKSHPPKELDAILDQVIPPGLRT